MLQIDGRLVMEFGRSVLLRLRHSFFATNHKHSMRQRTQTTTTTTKKAQRCSNISQSFRRELLNFRCQIIQSFHENSSIPNWLRAIKIRVKALKHRRQTPNFMTACFFVVVVVVQTREKKIQNKYFMFILSIFSVTFWCAAIRKQENDMLFICEHGGVQRRNPTIKTLIQFSIREKNSAQNSYPNHNLNARKYGIKMFRSV